MNGSFMNKVIFSDSSIAIDTNSFNHTVQIITDHTLLSILAKNFN